jgi:D-sedoheptulose 7-phosphate isomerase
MNISEELARHIDEHQDAARGMHSHLDRIAQIATLICTAFERGGRLYTFGNGGSAADAQHLAAELIGRYKRERRPLPAVALTTDPSVLTCVANDYHYDQVFARSVEGLARQGDVVIGFTTSGRSPSVVAGLAMARTQGATAVLFAAGDGGAAAQHAEVALLVPATHTARIQEMHLLALHLVSEWIDQWAVETER